MAIETSGAIHFFADDPQHQNLHIMLLTINHVRCRKAAGHLMPQTPNEQNVPRGKGKLCKGINIWDDH